MALINYTVNYYCDGNLYQTKNIQEEMNSPSEHVISIQDNLLSIEGHIYSAEYNLNGAYYISQEGSNTLIGVEEGAIIDLYYNVNCGTIYYFANGGTVNENYTVNEEGLILNSDNTVYTEGFCYGEKTKPADPSLFGLEKTGYTFAGWAVSEDVILSPDEEYDGTVYGDVANYDAVECYLEAQWSLKQYTITFDPDGGTLLNPGVNLNNGVNTNAVTVTYGSTDYSNMSNDIPTKEGYIFKGWFTDTTLNDYRTTKVYNSDGTCVQDNYFWNSENQWIYEGNRTLYAQWGQKKIKGVWKFNDFITISNIWERVNFISNNIDYGRISVTLANQGNAPFATLNYDTIDYYGENPEDYDIIFNSVYSFEDYSEYDKIGWFNEPYKKVDFGETEQVVSEGFYNWLIENATYYPDMSVSGSWKFNDILTSFPSDITEYINFTANNQVYQAIGADRATAPVLSLCYYRVENDYKIGYDQYYYEADSSFDIEIGWAGYQTINFGEEPQIVSGEFYEWLSKNAINFDNIKINITERGTTTLATAGKYCDRNIDVKVNIPISYDDELVNVSITEFINTTVEVIGVYGLGYKGVLKKIDVSNVKSISDKAFYNDRALDTLIIRTPQVCSLATTTNTFKNTKIEGGTGYIYVPLDLVEQYKIATNWITYVNQIVPFVSTIADADETLYTRYWIDKTNAAYTYNGTEWVQA